MEITEEMVKAVMNHQAAERRRQEKERHEQEVRRLREARENIRADSMTEVKKIFPEVTDKQFEELSEIFDAHFRAMEELY